MERPIGITVLAILSGIGGVFGVLGSLLLVAILPVIGIPTLLISIGYIALAFGFWTLQPWAWTAGIVLQGLSIALALLALVMGGGFNFVGLAVSGIILYYLFTPGVKAAFGRT